MAYFNHILVPLDGSPLAEGILPHLLALSDADTELTLTRVLQIETDTEQDQPVNPLDWQIGRMEVEAYLQQIAAKLKASGFSRVNTVVLEGEPAQRIVEYSEKSDASLILLSSHGKSGVSRWNVSSVVRKIIQLGRCSTMIVRAYNIQPAGTRSDSIEGQLYRRILVPLDGSMRSEVSLPAASALAQKHNAELMLVHVITRPEMIQRIPVTGEDQNLMERLTGRAREFAEKYMDQLKTRLPVDFNAQIYDSSDVIHTLQRLVDEQNIDLVVLSAHGHSADSHRMYGNVTSGLIEYGSAPTLIIQDLAPDEIAPSRAEEAAREHKGHA